MEESHSILFVRRLRVFRGHHLKVFDYMAHAASVPWLRPRLYAGPESDQTLLARLTPSGVDRVEAIEPADIYFVSGFDWDVLDKFGIDTSAVPVVHLIQHFYAADPDDPRHRYLARPALRICVAPEISEAVAPLASGPVVTIANGIDVHEVAESGIAPESRVFIGGLKNPVAARACADLLASAAAKIDLCDEALPRTEFLRRIRACEVAVLLPDPVEGFFLPALEAMALGSALVVPDCVGARSFCFADGNCLMPQFEPGAMASAALRLLRDKGLRTRLQLEGRKTAAQFTLERERSQAVAAFDGVIKWRRLTQ